MAVTETPTKARAEAKYVRAAPRKAKLVVDEIRGRPVPEARTILAFMTRDAARDVERVLRSAVANAEANHDLVGDDLYVETAYVGSGPTLKRWRARARGRVARIKKRTCHITLELAPAPPPPARDDSSVDRRERAQSSSRRSRKEAGEAPAARTEPSRRRGS